MSGIKAVLNNMDQSLSQKQMAEHMRKLTQLYRDVEDHKISEAEAAVRLGVLKVEQQRLNEAGIFPPNTTRASQGDGMIRRFKRARGTYQNTEHMLDFKCQCKACVRKHTITLADRDFLAELKITWGKTEVEVGGS